MYSHNVRNIFPQSFKPAQVGDASEESSDRDIATLLAPFCADAPVVFELLLTRAKGKQQSRNKGISEVSRLICPLGLGLREAGSGMSGVAAFGVQNNGPSRACGMQHAMQTSVEAGKPIRVIRTQRPFKQSLRATGISAQLRGRPGSLLVLGLHSGSRTGVDAF